MLHIHILQLTGDRKNRIKVTWRLWKCFLVLDSLLAKPWVGNPAPRLLSFVFIGYQGHPLHCFSLPPSNIFMAEIFSCQEYFHFRNIFMAGIFSCEEYYHGGNMSLSGTRFLGHSYPSSALQCFSSWEWGHHWIKKRQFSVAQILCYIEKWDLGMKTGDRPRCWRMKNLKLSKTDLLYERVRSGWRTSIWTFWTTNRAKGSLQDISQKYWGHLSEFCRQENRAGADGLERRAQ